MTSEETRTKAVGDCVLEVPTWNPQRDGGDDEICYIDLSAVSQATKTIESHTRVLPKDAPSRARQLVREGDILVSTVRPNLNGVARVPESLDGATASTGFCVLRPDPSKISSEYLLHWVKTPAFVLDMTRKATGASYPAVSDRIIFESLLPLPPLPEQQRIAAVLDQADALRAKRRFALAKLDTLTQSLFIDLFGNSTNPHQWPVVGLGDFLHFTTGKLDSNAAVANGDYPFFTCSRDDFRIDHYAFDCEALLLAGNNATADYSVKHYKGKFNAYQRTYVITLKDKQHSYAYAKVVLERKLAEMKRFSKGSNTKYLTLGILKAIEVQIPPATLQQEFEHQSALVERLEATQRASLLKLDALFASLQHRAFCGEL